MVREHMSFERPPAKQKRALDRIEMQVKLN